MGGLHSLFDAFNKLVSVHQCVHRLIFEGLHVLWGIFGELVTVKECVLLFCFEDCMGLLTHSVSLVWRMSVCICSFWRTFTAFR